MEILLFWGSFSFLFFHLSLQLVFTFFSFLLKSYMRRKHSVKYLQYLRSVEWKKKRLQVFLIQGRFCKNCGETKSLEINHLHYRTLFNEDPAADLEVLCSHCHRKYHGRIFKDRKRKPRNFRKRAKKLHHIHSTAAITMDQYRKTGSNPYIERKDTRW